MPQSVDARLNEADLLVSALENEGVEYIFGVPAEENVDVVESLRNSKIKLVLTRHERAATFMAATYGQFTCQRGVCIAPRMYAAIRYDDGQASMRSVIRSTHFNGLHFEPVLLSSVSSRRRFAALQKQELEVPRC